MSANGRIAWVDTGKGIGIILVVLAHIWLVQEGYNYINSFHVPLFFFLAGYLVDFDKYDDIKCFLTEKFNSILVPYFWFSIITYLYWLLIERNFSGNKISPTYAFINIFLAQGGDKYLPHNPALWFFTCLFMVTIIFYIIARKQSLINIVILLLVSGVIGYATTFYLPRFSPWSIDVVSTAIVFYGIGFIVKKSPILPIKSNYLRVLIICGCIPAGFIISQLNGRAILAENCYGNYFYFYIAAFLGIISSIMMAIILQKNNILLYLGRNAIIIFALHFPVKRLVMGLTCKSLHISLEQVKDSFVLSSIDTVITILILVPIIYIVRNYCYFMLGKNIGKIKLEKGI